MYLRKRRLRDEPGKSLGRTEIDPSRGGICIIFSNITFLGISGTYFLRTELRITRLLDRTKVKTWRKT